MRGYESPAVTVAVGQSIDYSGRTVRDRYLAVDSYFADIVESMYEPVV